MVGPEIQFNFHFKPHFSVQGEVWEAILLFLSVHLSSTPDWFLPQVSRTDM